MKTYYVDVVYENGIYTRLFLCKTTFDFWSKACSSEREGKHPFHSNTTLIGYNNQDCTISLKMGSLDSVNFGFQEKKINPLNDPERYNNPLN